MDFFRERDGRRPASSPSPGRAGAGSGRWAARFPRAALSSAHPVLVLFPLGGQVGPVPSLRGVGDLSRRAGCGAGSWDRPPLDSSPAPAPLSSLATPTSCLCRPLHLSLRWDSASSQLIPPSPFQVLSPLTKGQQDAKPGPATCGPPPLICCSGC